MRAARGREADGSPRTGGRTRPRRPGATKWGALGPLRAVATDHPLFVGQLVPGKDEEAAPAQELIFASGDDFCARLPPLVGFVFVFLVVLEAGGRRALAQDHIEGLRDVVGVELLV